MQKSAPYCNLGLPFSPRNIVAPLLVGVLAIAGCQNPDSRHSVAPTVLPKTEGPAPEEHAADRRRALLDTDIDFARASEEKGTAEAYLEFLTPDATLLPEGELPIQGRDAIKVHQAAGPEGILLWKPRAVEVASSGDLGYTWGTCEFRQSNPQGRQGARYGKYVTAWKKQPDGAWKAHLLIRNSSPPPEQRR
jgi:ketosteroid isomerase-like protein